MSTTIREHIARLEQVSITDPLTGLRNRRFLITEGPRLLHIALRSGARFSCLMIDIDHFKNVNDQHGHLMGDRFLQHVPARISESIRGSDLLARSRGEEFVVLAPNSGSDEARLLGERIRQAVAQNPYEAQGLRIGNTVSVGVAEYSMEPRFGSNLFEDMLERADRALYRAKAQGRNRVALWSDEDEAGPDI
jgi:diguanylate cyclase (GGDEF)-like protein